MDDFDKKKGFDLVVVEVVVNDIQNWRVEN